MRPRDVLGIVTVVLVGCGQPPPSHAPSAQATQPTRRAPTAPHQAVARDAVGECEAARASARPAALAPLASTPPWSAAASKLLSEAESKLAAGDYAPALRALASARRAGVRVPALSLRAACIAILAQSPAEANEWLIQAAADGASVATLAGDRCLYGATKDPQLQRGVAAVAKREAIAKETALPAIVTLYDEALRDAALSESVGDNTLARSLLAQRAMRRADEAREFLSSARSPFDHYIVARALSAGVRLRDWELARDEAVKAALCGMPDALRIAAAASDTWLSRLGYAQRFGTQWTCDPSGCHAGEHDNAVSPVETAYWWGVAPPAAKPLPKRGPAGAKPDGSRTDAWFEIRPVPLAPINRPGDFPVRAREQFASAKALERGETQTAFDLARRAWDLGSEDASTAITAARAACALNSGEAVMWLSRAIDRGWHNADALANDPAFDAVRAVPTFSTLLAKVGAAAARSRAARNPELARLVEEDQAARQTCFAPGLPAWSMQIIVEHDAERREKVRSIVNAGGARVGEDFHAAALVMQHGQLLADWQLARKWALIAAEKGDRRGLWLAAAAWDRWLVNAGYPQRFGTQSMCAPECKLLPVDKDVSDDERLRWDVPPITAAAE